MPKLSPKAAKLTASQIQYLIDGGLDQALFNDPPAFNSDRQMSAAWRLWGDSITADYTRQHPNRRPCFWWIAKGLKCPHPDDEARVLGEINERELNGN